jgi:hypothetical protein
VSQLINVYCDESCHLENDHHKSMVLGLIWCPQDQARTVSDRLREIKAKYHVSPSAEIKWTKISPKNAQMFLDIVDYFFDDDDLHFRALIIPDKAALKHAAHGQTHDQFYYKMFFNLLKAIIDPRNRYHIYLDIKDTQGRSKIAKLHEVLCHNAYDFQRQIIARLQLVPSREVGPLQLADLIVGAVSFVNRGLDQQTGVNAGKLEVVNRIRKKSGYTLTRTTMHRESKVNVFAWRPQEELPGGGQ